MANNSKRQQQSVVANHDIRAPKVRVIDENNNKLGVLDTSVAKRQAFESNLDLVLITDKADVPVCRIVDMGKFLYEQKQKAKEAARNQRQSKIEVKEVQFRPNIDIHDFETKCKHVTRFIAKGALVKVLVQFKGRERSRTEKGFDIINRIVDTVQDVEFDSKPTLYGNRIIAVLRKTKENV